MDDYINNIFNKHFTIKNNYSKSHTLYNSKTVTKPHIKKKLHIDGYWTHINYNTFKYGLESLLKYNNKSFYTIVETGCSAKCGVKSTKLWDDFVNYYDGEVYSVDLDQQCVTEANKLTSNKTQVECNDSLNFLKKFNKPIDLLYLDSYNVDWSNPNPSAEHHLKEFNAIKYNLHKNSIIIIDDTPKDINWMDLDKNHKKFKPLIENKILFPMGKGTYVNDNLYKHNDLLLLHQYQIVWKINSLFN